MIVGVVTALALPKIDYTRYRVDSSIRGVGATLLAAQRRAVSRQYNVIITFDAANQSIRLHEDANNNGQQDSGERTTGISLGEQVVIGRGATPAHSIGAGPVTFTKRVGGVPALTFHRNGSASQMGGVYLTSRRALNSGSHLEDTRLLAIERATGRVSWYGYVASKWERGF